MSRAKKTIQLTLCILKPHVCAAPHVKHDIQREILDNGFYILKTKDKSISRSEATTFYEEHIGKFFFNRLVTFMCSGPCAFHILAKENAIEEWRTLLGPTKVFKTQFTHFNTIRGQHGLTDTRNAAHGSDSMASAAREISVFFPDFKFKDWLQRDLEDLRWDKDAFTHLPS